MRGKKMSTLIYGDGSLVVFYLMLERILEADTMLRYMKYFSAIIFQAVVIKFLPQS